VEPKMPQREGDSGQAPLPERIRIYSPQLLRIFNGFGCDIVTDGRAITFLRPFRFLVYYNLQLRELAAKLERKFTDFNITNDSATTGALPVAENLAKTQESKAGVESDAEDEDENDLDENTSSPAALLHLRCLLQFMDTDIKAKMKWIALPQCQKVSFSDLWHLFKPGDEVIDQKEKQAYRITRVTIPEHKTIAPWHRFMSGENTGEPAERPVEISCVYIDFDGEKLGPVIKIFEIPKFGGDKAVASLPIYPLRFAKDKNLEEKLVKRGQMLLDVIHVKPMYYTGLTIDKRDEVDSQVVIDFAEAFAEERNKSWKPEIDLIGTSTEGESREINYCDASCCKGQSVYSDSG